MLFFQGLYQYRPWRNSFFARFLRYKMLFFQAVYEYTPWTNSSFCIDTGSPNPLVSRAPQTLTQGHLHGFALQKVLLCCLEIQEPCHSAGLGKVGEKDLFSVPFQSCSAGCSRVHDFARFAHASPAHLIGSPNPLVSPSTPNPNPKRA